MSFETLHGRRALVYDSVDFKNDRDTPISMLMRPATIVCHYGCRSVHDGGIWKYEDVVDVRFDHKPDVISHGHFTDMIELLFAPQEELAKP